MPVMVIDPELSRLRSSVVVPLAVTASAAPAGTTVFPVLVMVPPAQVAPPARVSSPAPPRVPPVNFRDPLRTDAAPIAREPPDISRLALLTRLWMDWLPEEREIVTGAGVTIATSSEGVGRASFDQLAGVVQRLSPPP